MNPVKPKWGHWIGVCWLAVDSCICLAGFRTLGFDVDQSKVEKLQQGESYISHLPSEWIADCINNQSFQPTSDMSRLSEVDVILICVPTPLTGERDPDLQYVVKTTETIAKFLSGAQLWFSKARPIRGQHVM